MHSSASAMSVAAAPMEVYERDQQDDQTSWEQQQQQTPQLEATCMKKALFKEAMRGNWNEVLDIYKNNSDARRAQITRNKDTVLHVAVSEGNLGVVKALLEAMRPDSSADQVLRLQNERGNTPLHSAAALGMVDICATLANECPGIITKERNKKGQTPLFVAADVGKKKVFFALQARIIDFRRISVSVTDKISYCRSSRDGNNILHRAIYGEYFDLAFEILHLYPFLVNLRNVKGETALHLLAAKPSAFESGNRSPFLDRLLYACVYVEPLTVKYSSSKSTNNDCLELQFRQTNFELPRNYGICVEIFFIFRKLLEVLLVTSGRKPDTPPGAREEGSDDDGPGNGFGLPQNYLTCFNFLNTIMKCFLIILGTGYRGVEKIKRKKRNQTHAKQIMIELVKRTSELEYEDDGTRPPEEAFDKSSLPPDLTINSEVDQIRKLDDGGASHHHDPHHPSNDTTIKGTGPLKETPILLAARMGIIEIVKKIVEDIPIAIHDVDSKHRNIVLVAAAYRQPHIYRYMLDRGKMREALFGTTDDNGNTAVHLAASKASDHHTHLWNIPGAALQMHWEIKWYKFVKNSMELNFFAHYNNEAQTSREMFTKHHSEMVKEGAKWLTETAESCSVVAALIATVAFASATAIPGGMKSDSGRPELEGQVAFDVFAISALVALCFSVTSLVMFLTILTSRYQEMDFEVALPMKLILGLTSLFMSIASMMVAFCGAHFYLIASKLGYAALPIYVVVCIPVTLYAMAQFPLYFDLVKAFITHVPERAHKMRSV